MSAAHESKIASSAAKRQELLDELRSRASGLEWCSRHSDLADELVRAVYGQVAASLDELPPIAIIATGGYGRQELSPWSDMDLTVVPSNDSHPGLERAVKTLYRELHDSVGSALGLKVGYALRFVSDCPSLDPRTRSGLIDARFIVGSHEAFESLTREFWSSFPVAEFVIDKIEEHTQHLAKTNDTPLATQPDLKQGAGGLRSFQTSNWIGAALGERMSRPGRDYQAVLKVRNLLHLIAGRSFDVLTHAKRQEVADLLGSDPFSVGSSLADSLVSLDTAYRKCLERLNDSRFLLAKNVEAIRGEARIAPQATLGQAAVGIANATKLGLQVSDTKAEPESAVGAHEALAALAAGEETLRNLDRSGVLEGLLPELTACRTVMPQDVSHDFSVFEHTLRVVRNLDGLEPDSFFGSIAADLRDRAPLYLAALLHDVGRIEGEEGHAEAGARIAQEVCQRWHVYDSTSETVCWLVREHLTLDRILRMRDVTNPDTVAEFAGIVETPERLAMLTLLTWSDISAVNPHAWTLAQETYMRELYSRTLAALSVDSLQTADPATYRRRLVEQSRSETIGDAEFERFLDTMPAHYIISTAPDVALSHLGLLKRAKAGEASVSLNQLPEMGGTDVTICCRDSKGLLSRILGVLYALDLSIVAIRASTTADDDPVALDTITVSFGNRPVPASTAGRLVKTMTSVLNGEAAVADVLLAAKKSPERSQQVLTYHFVEGSPGIVEVQAPRGRGMAYRLARQLSSHGINILSARVGQWAGSGTASFYVTMPDGSPVSSSLVAEALEAQKVS